MPTRSGHGIQLHLGDGAGAFTTIAQIETLTPPGWERQTEDVPTHDDPAGSGVQRIAHALYSGTSVTLTILHDPADLTHQDLEALKSAAAASEWKVIYPVTPVVEVDFNAWVTAWQPQGVDASSGLLRTQVTLMPSGDV